MADVKQFELDGTVIDVKDNIARTTASSASALANTNAQEIANLKALSRLTVAYDTTNEKIVFSTQTS